MHPPTDPVLTCTCESGAALRRAMEAELRLARDVQSTLLPSSIEAENLRVLVRMLPCWYVGGDYVQVSMPRLDVLYLCVADVAGHGVAAALVVSRLHGHVRRLILEEQSPRQFVEELNLAALRIFRHLASFVTLAVFRVDLAARRIEYATAGHPAQVLLRADGRFELLSTPNRLLGVDEAVLDPRRPAGWTTFGPGDSLVLFTDGLFEVLDAGGERLDEEALHERLRRLTDRTPERIVDTALGGLAAIPQPTRFDDDVSLVVASFEPAPVSAAEVPGHFSGSGRDSIGASEDARAMFRTGA